MFGVTISARGRKARSCENTRPHQQKKNQNDHVLIRSAWWRRFLFPICCEGGDITQDQYVAPPRDQSRLHVSKALPRRSIPNTSATTYTTVLPVYSSQSGAAAGWLVRRRQFAAHVHVCQVPLSTAPHAASPSQLRGANAAGGVHQARVCCKKNISSNWRNAPFVCAETLQ